MNVYVRHDSASRWVKNCFLLTLTLLLLGPFVLCGGCIALVGSLATTTRSTDDKKTQDPQNSDTEHKTPPVRGVQQPPEPKQRHQAALERQKRDQEAALERRRLEQQEILKRQRMEAQREQERQQKERSDQDLLKTNPKADPTQFGAWLDAVAERGMAQRAAAKLELEKQKSLARREREARDAEFRDKIRLEEQKRYEAIKSYVAAKLTAYRKVEFLMFDGPRDAVSIPKKAEKPRDGLLYFVSMKARTATGASVRVERYFFLVDDRVEGIQASPNGIKGLTICELKEK